MNATQFEQFQKQGYSRIPVSQEVLADLESPLSIYLKLAQGPGTFLFESMQGGEKWGRYSIIGLPSQRRIEIRGNTIKVLEAGRILEQFESDDPLGWIEQYQQSFTLPEIAGLPRITGGLVGYFGYDTVRYIEPRLGENQAEDELDLPDILLLVCEEICVFDNLSASLQIILLPDASLPDAYENALKRLASIVASLESPLTLPAQPEARSVNESDFLSSFGEAPYKKAVEKIRQYITDGECMQVVLSQSLQTDFAAEPVDLYRALRRLNPSPYMFYLDFGDHQVVGSSPEILVRLDQGEVTVRPLAGTRPRGETPEDDVRLEQELLADPKEIAEHLMLIDLGRNDIGRIAETGSVRVTDQMDVERYSHVMHIVSNVTGQLKSGMKPIDVLRATFPAGTLSGAPKVRAMEIIQELEPVKRSVYSGSIGYLSWNGNMDTCIAIRTAVIKGKKLHVQAGAGIVYDSDPQKEWDETMNKARAIFRAVAVAENGIHRQMPLVKPGVKPRVKKVVAADSPDTNQLEGGAQ